MSGTDAVEKAFQALKEQYIGRKTKGLKPGRRLIWREEGNEEVTTQYAMTVYVDDEGLLVGMERMVANVYYGGPRESYYFETEEPSVRAYGLLEEELKEHLAEEDE